MFATEQRIIIEPDDVYDNDEEEIESRVMLLQQLHYREQQQQQHQQQQLLYKFPSQSPNIIVDNNNISCHHVPSLSSIYWNPACRPPVGEIMFIPKTSSTNSASSTSDLRDSTSSMEQVRFVDNDRMINTENGHQQYVRNHDFVLNMIEQQQQQLLFQQTAWNEQSTAIIQPTFLTAGEPRVQILSQPLPGRPVPTAVTSVPTLIRPTALKVARPVPQRAAEAFYDAVSQLQLPSSQVQSAIKESTEWHRKWVHQDETAQLYTQFDHGDDDDDEEVEIVFEAHNDDENDDEEDTPLSSLEADSSLMRPGSVVGSVRRFHHKRSSSCSGDNEEDDEEDELHPHCQQDAMLWVDLMAADREKGARNPSPDAITRSVSGPNSGSDPEGEGVGENSLTSGSSSEGFHIFVVERTKRSRLSYMNNNGSTNGSKTGLVGGRCTTSPSTLSPSDDGNPATTPNPFLQRNAIAPSICDNSSGLAFHRANAFPIQAPQPLGVQTLVRPTPIRVQTAAAAAVAVSVSQAANRGIVIARPRAMRPIDHVRQPSQLAGSTRGRPPVDHIIHAIYDHDESIASRSSRHRRSLSPLTVSTIGFQNGSVASSRTSNKKTKKQRSDQPTPVTTEEEFHQTTLEKLALDDHPGPHVIESYGDDIIESEDGVLHSQSWILEPHLLPMVVMTARDGILHSLAISGGDTTSAAFLKCVEILSEHYRTERMDRVAEESSTAEDGMWLTLTKPTFFGNLGDNDNGDPMYTLGRMSFDMFSPTSIVCSLQGNFNSVQTVSDENREHMMHTNRDMMDHYCAIPKKFQDEVESGGSILKTYDIITAFTIEPSLAAYPKTPNKDVRRPIRGFMTTYGYMLPDPMERKRQSVWITGGKIEPNSNPEDRAAWLQLFQAHPPKHDFSEKAKLLAVKLLMGATIPESMDVSTGKMEYTFTRPLGGHGMAYIDTLYCDKTLRIVKGHRGTVFVFTRMAER